MLNYLKKPSWISWKMHCHKAENRTATLQTYDNLIDCDAVL